MHTIHLAEAEEGHEDRTSKMRSRKKGESMRVQREVSNVLGKLPWSCSLVEDRMCF